MLLKYRFFKNFLIRSKNNSYLICQVKNLSSSQILNDHKIELSSKNNTNHKDQSTEDKPNKDLKSKLDNYIKNYNKEAGFDWKQFYKFNHIKTAAMITKAKIYQSGLVVVLFVDSTHKFMLGTMPADTYITINSLTIASLLFLVAIGQLARRLVGIVYYDPSHPDLIRIARLTFFGRRQNLVVNLKEITPLTDTNLRNNQSFFRLIINIDGKDRAYFIASEKLATIDSEIYEKVFGTLK